MAKGITIAEQNRWMEENYALYVFFTRKFLEKYSSLPPDEVRSAVNVGFTLALQRYDPKRGKISTLIAVMIQGEISHWLQSMKRQKREGATTSLDARLSPDRNKDITLREVLHGDADTERIGLASVEAQRAMRDLTADQREAIYEYFWLGYNYAQIGKRRGTTASAARTLVLRALDACRKSLRVDSVAA